MYWIVFAYIFVPLWILRWAIRRTYRRCRTRVCLVNKTAVVTGGSRGIGYEVALDLASRGARVFLTSRSEKTAREAAERITKATGNSHVFGLELDLSSFRSVREFGQKIKDEVPALDILIHNASTGGIDRVLQNEDGLPYVFASNVLGAFLLTHILVDNLKEAKNPRLIFVSSVVAYLGHLSAKLILNEDGDRDEKLGASGLLQYSASKLGEAAIALEMHNKIRNSAYAHIKVNALHPGNTNTDIFDAGRHSDDSYFKRVFLFVFKMFVCPVYLRTAEEGAQRIINYAVSNKFRDVTGNVDTGFNWIFGMPKCLKSPKYTADIWDACERLVKLKENEKLKL